MQTQTSGTHLPNSFNMRMSVQHIAAAQPVLFYGGALFLLMLLPSALGLWLDARTLNGISVWIKPMKFQAATWCGLP